MRIEGNLYELSNGNVLRVYSMCDDPEYEFGYDYFNGTTKKMIDGGVFNIELSDTGGTSWDTEVTENAVVDAAMHWCGLNPSEVNRSLIGIDIEYSDLEDDGYSGF